MPTTAALLTEICTPIGSVRAWTLDGIDYASFLVPILPGDDFTVVTGFRRKAPSIR